MTRIVTTTVLIVTLATSGCAAMLIPSSPTRTGSCRSWMPLADVSAAATMASWAIWYGGLASDFDDAGLEDLKEHSKTNALFLGLGAGAYGIAALMGAAKAHECRDRQNRRSKRRSSDWPSDDWDEHWEGEESDE